MNKEEYLKVSSLTYREYCDYLQKKYGLPKYDYYTPDFEKNDQFNGHKNTRTNDGLFIHHIFEDHGIDLSKEPFASKNPWEWQKRENLCFADYLEHLFLHILICQYPSKNANKGEAVGIGGVVKWLVPALNDFYSGLVPEKWHEKTGFAKIANDRDVYVLLVRRFLNYQEEHNNPHIDFKPSRVFRSFHKKIWDATKNEELYCEIDPNWKPTFSEEYWAHEGGDECLFGGTFIEDICPNCINPVCLKKKNNSLLW